MATINNVTNYSNIPQPNQVSGESKKLDDIVRKKKVEDKDVQTALPTALTGGIVQQNSLLRLSLALRGHDEKVTERSPKAVVAAPDVIAKVMTVAAAPTAIAKMMTVANARTAIAEVMPEQLLASEKSAVEQSLKTDKPAERKEFGEVKKVVIDPALAKSPPSEGVGTNPESRAATPVTVADSIKVAQQTDNRPTAEQEHRDVSDKPLSHRNDVTLIPPQSTQQGARHVEMKESAGVKRESQQMLLRNAEGVDAGRTVANEPVKSSSNLTYNFSEWGSGHRVNVQLTAQQGMPLVLSPSDNLVQDRLADQGGQDERGQPLWIFQDEQDQQQSRGGKPPKYAEEPM
ncbi:SpaN/EivJ family type III secretion system needle length determinant [Scandinavium lactucae]|uniref:Type III secretion system needle length determinant, SpaN/EivJ family n=1 Tax=Scandinavium lactucae TaxID=3095028 RepID=A0ABU4QN71_9ENTR|nr:MULTISPECIES: type III secretion system needle length determinant, SpaN/EivJ family [unclassified Scandinavium]MDX6039942.1 type III secretion system needle length determinant, SpaN/EivJ family [Scandinavium sp. V105_6]MDX6051870.1 type III secretion system needle length determinant, SpaN/EivJ family [Scandinavium sp. V105_1]